MIRRLVLAALVVLTALLVLPALARALEGPDLPFVAPASISS